MNTKDICHALSADEIDVWADRAHAANGFGDAVLPHTQPSRRTFMPALQSPLQPYVDSARYAKCVEVSKRIRWDIDRDVIRHREFDFRKKFLPDGLSFVDRLPFLGADERRLLSQIQGRTYANIFGLVERFIAAKVLDVSRDHELGDQNALEALVRFADEEIKHQELFRRIERMCAKGMPEGYTFLPEPNAVASAVLTKSTWAVLALTCHIELFVLAHYRESIGTEADVSDLWKDVFLFHWKEESQHAILDELEWRREHARLTEDEREQGVTDLIELVGAVDGILQIQAKADADYFVLRAGPTYSAAEQTAIHDVFLKAYRWQYIISGVQGPRFVGVLKALLTPVQMDRIGKALSPILAG
jgi:DNA-binding Lrp family transcriptional regulator